MTKGQDVVERKKLELTATDGNKLPVPARSKDSLVPETRPVAQLPSQVHSTDPLHLYLTEVRRFKLLTREEENELLKNYKLTGDKETGMRIITSNLRLVVKIAMEFHSHWLNNLLDLIQEGNLGLMQALRKFDPSRGVKFSYYASYWIKAYILKHIMDNWRLVKVGTTQAQRKLFYNLKKEQEKLINKGIDPVSALLAERLGVKEIDVNEMDVRMAGWEVSLDAPVNDESERTQMSLLPSPEEGSESLFADAQIRGIVSNKFNMFRETLSPRELAILNKRLLTESPVTLQEIGEEFGISRERVRQVEERLRKILRDFMLKEIPEIKSWSVLQ